MPNSFEDFLRQNLPTTAVPDDFCQRVQRCIALTPRAKALPRWAFAVAAGLSILALLGGFETGRCLVVPARQPLPLEQAMLLLNQ